MRGRNAQRRVLVVVSAFKPAIIADMQRARMLAWELRSAGWELEILTPRAQECRQDIIEPDSETFFPEDVKVHSVGSGLDELWRLMGSHTHGWRTIGPMYQAGRQLLREGRFDIVYISTTTFQFFMLGYLWNREFSIRYILDLHDPWIRDRKPHLTSWKSAFLQWLSERMERLSVLNAAGLISVSGNYIDVLKARYQDNYPEWLSPDRNAVIPFGAMERDFFNKNKLIQLAEGGDDELSINYVGAGGRIMMRSFTLICRALGFLRSQGDRLAARARLRLFGTIYDWKIGDPKPLETTAREAGIGDLVTELPTRVSYRRSIELLFESRGAMILGVDDAGYMPSKLFSYALSGKPLIASLRRDSPAFDHFRQQNTLGHALWFDENMEMPVSEAADVMRGFLDAAASRQSIDRRAIVEPFLASAMAQRHAAIFDACLVG